MRITLNTSDAQYFLVKNDIDSVHWLNENLGKCMQWQELPEIQHPEVKLFGELDVFYPNWASSLTIPNNQSKEEIETLVSNYLSKD